MLFWLANFSLMHTFPLFIAYNTRALMMSLPSHTRMLNGKIHQRFSIEIQIHEVQESSGRKNRATDAYEISSFLGKLQAANCTT